MLDHTVDDDQTKAIAVRTYRPVSPDDGRTTASWELWPAERPDGDEVANAPRAGRHAPATLLIEAAEDGSIRKAELLVAGREAPPEPW